MSKDTTTICQNCGCSEVVHDSNGMCYMCGSVDCLNQKS